MKNNIFTYEGPRGELVEVFYKLLVSGNVVSYEDVLVEYDGGTLSSVSITAHDLYKTLKHVVPEVVDSLQKNGYDVISFQMGRSTSYQYIGADPDPLRNIRFKALITERYVVLSDCIKSNQSVKIKYKPFNRKEMDLIFHPHLLHEYNGRLFVLGVSEKQGREPMRKFNIALDRIIGEIRSAGSMVSYLPSFPNEYSYLANIVGVSLEEGEELCAIKLRALDIYTFGRLTTKPIHNSQKTIHYPNPEESLDCGEVELKVIPNVELIGQILSYGSYLEVLSPEHVRIRVANELRKALSIYGNGSAFQELI